MSKDLYTTPSWGYVLGPRVSFRFIFALVVLVTLHEDLQMIRRSIAEISVVLAVRRGGELGWKSSVTWN
ncbi:hypothetical protein BDV93DRAFT_524513 [Ceratobasidium sp. AG-I]|nr:hypothetical protein BDV93DRAFT_524513 [Ceratobasidium sp. AG-I]